MNQNKAKIESRKRLELRRLRYDDKTTRVRISKALNDKLLSLKKELQLKTIHEVISFLLSQDEIEIEQSKQKRQNENPIHFKDLSQLESCRCTQQETTISSFVTNQDIHCHCSSSKETCTQCN